MGQTNNLHIRHLNHRILNDGKRNQYIDAILSKHHEILPTILWIGSSENVDSAECHFIKEYDSIYPSGYNFESGGCKNKNLSEDVRKRIANTLREVAGKPVLAYDLEGNFVREYRSMAEATEILGLKTSSGISQLCRGKHSKESRLFSCKGFQWRYKTEDYPLKIEPIPEDRYNKLKEWERQRREREKMPPKYVHWYGEDNPNYGRHWSEEHNRHMSELGKAQWANADEETRAKWTEHLRILNKKRMKPILQYDVEGNFIREWSDILELMNHYHITVNMRDSIRRCMNGRTSGAYGYQWRHKTENFPKKIDSLPKKAFNRMK